MSACLIVKQSGEQVPLAEQSGWQPDITVTPVNSPTLSVSVAGVTASTLAVRVYPETGPASSAVNLTYDNTNRRFVGTINLAKRTFAADLHFYDPTNRGRGVVTNFALGSGADLFLREGETLRVSSGRTLVLQDGTTVELSAGDVLAMNEEGLTLRISSGRTHVLREGNAPVSFSDGQMTLYSDQIDVAPGMYFILQPATILPSPPLWTTVVGQAYRLTASSVISNLQGAPIGFSYLGREVAADKEKLLKIYHWDGRWQASETKVDEEHNIAYASAKGQGVYVLMYSIDIPLAGPGWNQFGYPIPDSKPITSALSSISGTYDSVHHYNAFVADPLQRWTVFAAPPAPAWINTLHVLTYNQVYWIHISATQVITLQLADVAAAYIDASTPPAVYSPPALYYGTVTPSDDFTPAAGMPVRAWIDNTLCGVSATRTENGQVVYAVLVYAAESNVLTTCGKVGKPIRFTIGDRTNLWC